VQHSRVYWLTCILAILFASVAGATTIVMPSDEALVAKSPLIIEGTVVRSTPVAQGDAIWTETVVSVAKTLKGAAADTVTIREIGGILGDRITKIFGAPEYTAGEHVLLFLTPTPRGDYQTTDLYVGKFTDEMTLNGQRLWSRHDDAGDVTLLDRNLAPLAPSHVQRDAAGFEQFVANRVDGREAAHDYEVLNPVIRKQSRTTLGVTSNFTVISEPTIYRWTLFDNGQSAKWYSYGTQPGYTNGGVTEVQTAMSVWNNYTAALIRYAYSGTTSGNIGGLSGPNGVNEILFNDPKAEIAGSWNPSTGGVVGEGGFNGVGGAQQWTSPFAADAGHPQRTYTAWTITEANLTIQDNVSSTAGISSSTLAEIIAHEFGHTLGFGHSTDPTALMYPSVTPGGPTLRSDDQVAARWLYPSGNSAPPPTVTVPAAPTNLTATPSGLNVTLSWSDNATNETGQSVYMAIGSGAFSKVGDLAAGQTQVTLTGFTAGTYRFYVVAFNSAGNSPQSNTATATVAASVQAAFTFTPSTGTAGTTTFTFTDTSSGSVTSRLWNFGDGSTSTAAIATHVYAGAGQYTVTLTINGGQSSVAHAVLVTSPSPALSSAFAWAPSNPTTDTNVTFYDQSSGSPAGWLWNFGDGSTATSQNAVKRYTTPGTYTVTLTISRPGSASATSSQQITVAAGTPALPAVNAGFTFAPNSPTAGQTIAFTDTSTGSPATWQWSFGDGTTSSQQNPSHVYTTPGSYAVTLTVTNAISTATVTHALNVASAAVPYRALISVIAQTPGAGGSSWRTELTLFNAGSQAVTPNLIFVPGAGGQVRTRTIYIAPQQSVTYQNTLLELFGLNNGAGALGVEADGVIASPDLRVSSRTFTDGANGTYGQSVGGVTPDDLPTVVYVTGMESDSAFRTNVGLVNRTSTPGSVRLDLFDGTGALVGTTTQQLAANTFGQSPLTVLFPSVASGSYSTLSMRVTSAAAGAISAYASIVDNRTQDPVYVQGAAAPLGGRLVLPAVGRAPGANGTFWRSDVTLYNPTQSTLSLTLKYGSATRALSIPAGRTTVLADVLQSTFGIASGTGALELYWNNTAGPVTTSRTYTTAPGGGTYGQSIDPVESWGNDAYVPGLRSDFSFRSNVGFVNGGETTIGVTTQLLASNGQVLATGFVALQPHTQTQMPLASMFPAIDPQSAGSVTLKAHADGQPNLFAYGSIVDNASGDPVFFAGR
jgi:PKD repeat protein